MIRFFKCIWHCFTGKCVAKDEKCGECKCDPCECEVFDLSNFETYVEMYTTKKGEFRHRLRNDERIVATTRTHPTADDSASDVMDMARALGICGEKHLSELKKKIRFFA